MATIHFEGATGCEDESFACSVCGMGYTGDETHSCILPESHPMNGAEGITFTISREAEISVSYSAAPYYIVKI